MRIIKRLWKRSFGALSTKFRLSLGLTLLALSLLVSLIWIDLVPDRQLLVREGRTQLSEAVAANVSALITLADQERLQAIMNFIVERNEDLLSLGVRSVDGQALVIVGEHDAHWQALWGDHSIETQIQVPIWRGPEKWGTVQLRFAKQQVLGAFGAFLGLKLHPHIVLVLIMAVLGMAVFYFYLGRALRHLDPSKAVPPRVRAALDTLAEGLMVVDLDGYIVLANQAFAKIVGREADDLIGDQAKNLQWRDAEDAVIETVDLPWERSLVQQAPLNNERIRLSMPGQSPVSFSVNCSPVLGDDQRHGGVLVSFDDVTILEAQQQQLRESRDAAEEANQAKSAFLANMSHEIRTPMNAILGFTEVLRRGNERSGPDWKKHLNTIYSSGRHLLELINDILDLSKVESGKLEVERIDAAPHPVIHEVVKVLRVKAEEKGIVLDFEAHGPQPERISTDPGRLRQIVTNLVGNAIKFTELGGVKVVARLLQEEQPVYVIDVSDSGIGMGPEQLKSIFNPFEQADTSITRRFGGTGLGLSISKQFAEALGGGISVTSEPGQGSTFTVRLDPGPLDGVTMLSPDELRLDDMDEDRGGDSSWRFPSSRVLVVDDGKQNCDLLNLVLSDVNLQVEIAENGQIAVEKAGNDPYDIVLMDINMPVMDGFTAVALMREMGLEIPILALTADVMTGFESKVLAGGFSGYVPKPINIDGLLSELAGLLGAEKVAADEAETVSPPAQAVVSTVALPAAPTTGAAPIVSSLPVSDPRFRAIVEEFVDQLGAKLGEVDQAWAGRDFDALRSLAHYLKGAGGSVGLDAFTEPSAALEQLAKAGREDGAEALIAELHGLADRVVVDPADAVRASAAEEPARVEVALPAPSAHAPPIVSSLPMSDPRFRAIVEEFVAQLGPKIDEIDQAWAAHDFDALRSLAHYLKGAGGSVGLDAFTEPSAALEQLAKAGSAKGIETLIVALRDLAARVVVDPADAVRAVAAVASVRAEVVQPLPAADVPPIVSSLPVSDPRFRAIVEEFMEQLEAKLADIQWAWDTRDFDELQGLAHYLKGAGGSVGLDAFTKPSAKLEQLAKARSEEGVTELIETLRGLAGRVVLDAPGAASRSASG